MLISDYPEKPLIAVHRGKSGANVVENTVTSALCALASGADIVEFDVQSTLDGKVVVGHTNTEFCRYHNPLLSTSLLPYSLLKHIQFKSAYGQKSGYCINSLEEYLLALKGKCLLNLDRIWCSNPRKVLEQIKNADMFNSIIIKSKVDSHTPAFLDLLSRYNNVCYMAICKNRLQFDNISKLCKQKNISLWGVEILFKQDNDYFCSEEFLSFTHNNNIITWVNAINLSGKHDICGGHGDMVSITCGAEHGWRWLINKGYSIIQTDWPALLAAEIRKHSN